MELLVHWQSLNTALPAPGLILPDGVDRAGAQQIYNDLQAKHAELQEVQNDGEIGETRAGMARKAAMGRMREFCSMVRTYWEGLPVAKALPELPRAGHSLDKVLRAARRVLRLWTRANAGAAPPGVALPLVLPNAGGCARAGFLALYDEVRAAQAAAEDAESDLEMARAERDGLERRLRRALHHYRVLVPVRMGRESAWAETLPRLSPLPGHTPDRPVVEAALVEGALRLTWAALEEPDLKCWQVRVCRSPKYDLKRERVLATLPPEAPRVWDAGAPQGASFRVYAVLGTGNERGSKTVRAPAGQG